MSAVHASVAPADGWCRRHRLPVLVERPFGMTSSGVPITEWVCIVCAAVDRASVVGVADEPGDSGGC